LVSAFKKKLFFCFGVFAHEREGKESGKRVVNLLCSFGFFKVGFFRVCLGARQVLIGWDLGVCNLGLKNQLNKIFDFCIFFVMIYFSFTHHFLSFSKHKSPIKQKSFKDVELLSP
jgi:hypothetical protein